MTTIADLMTHGPYTVRPDDLVGDTRDVMLETGVHCIPVIDDNDRVVGIVTSWDLVDEYPPEESIRNAMSARVKRIGAHQSPSDAAKEMRASSIHHLVVVDDMGAIVGVLSSLDLLAEIT